MPTFRESISRVRSLDKLLSADNVISDRAIQAELRSSAILFIKRETDKRKLWTSDSLFTPLPCVDLKEVPIAECCDYTSHETIARSIHKLPKIAEGNFQRLIQGVYNISNRKRITEVSIDRYINLLKLKIRKKETYFWIYDQYIYITDPDVKRVNVVAYFEEDVPPEFLQVSTNCKDCPCTSTDVGDLCLNPLDKEFKFPGYLEEAILTQVRDNLLKNYYQIRDDKTSDLKDDQVDTK